MKHIYLVRHWSDGLFLLSTSTLTATPFGKYVQKALLCGRMAVYWGTCYALSYLFMLKLNFAVLPRVRPVAIFGKTVVLTKERDVREVLKRFEDFTLGGFIAPGMPWGSSYT